MVKKSLVFHFFVPVGYKDNIAVRMHLECFRRYSNIFDSATFVICTSDGNNDAAIEVEHDLIDCGFNKDVRFIIKENDHYCEARTFKELIIDRLDEYDGIVFFGHTKGVTNVENYPERTENVLKWIYGMYFYSFEFMCQVEKKMIGGFMGKFTTLYGPFMQKTDWGFKTDKDTSHFPGTFYWLNPSAILNDVRSGEITIPIMSDRFYAEMFPNIYPYNGGWGKLDSHMSKRIEPYDFYRNSIDSLVRFFGDYEPYVEKYNDIKKIIDRQ